jgi:excisionase family DNA binding protein
MNPMESDHEILTVREICDLLQVHQSTIYKMVRQGKIPCFRIGSDWRFRRDRIVRWMAERTMAPIREKNHRRCAPRKGEPPFEARPLEVFS